MKTFFVGALLGLLLVTLLFVVRPGQANAAPEYGYRFTARHGWIVWADNDRYYPIRTTCKWRAGGTRWHISWRIQPFGYRWAYSDAGSWGNFRPRYLRCSYVRAW